MHEDPVPSCFRAGSAAALPASTATGPCLTTSIYETTLGLAAFTWWRTVLGLCLRVELALPSTGPSPAAAAAYWSSSASTSNDVASVSGYSDCGAGFATYRFRIRPWLLWKRRGTKRFQVRDPGGGGGGGVRGAFAGASRTFEFAWDVSRASFPRGGGPEPKSGFFVSVAVDGELFLVIGDAVEDALRKTKVKKLGSFVGPAAADAPRGSPLNPVLVSRREHVVLQESSPTPYATKARIGGQERDISIDLAGGTGVGVGAEKDGARFSVELDGKRVLQVKHLRWKFRGNERVDVNGDGMQVSWDVYSWLFPKRTDNHIAISAAPAAANPDLGYAVFVLRFDKQESGVPQEDKSLGAKGRFSGGSGGGGAGGRGLWGKYGIGSSGVGDLSSSSSFLGIGDVGAGKRKGRRSLLKTKSSSSSSSSASSATSSTVMEWTSAEENELKESDGFSLLVYVWRR